jgi:hypothetical protein
MSMHSLGWVPKALVRDNRRLLVAGRYEPGVTRLAAHYGTTVMPTRPRKQRDMVKVEVARSSRCDRLRGVHHDSRIASRPRSGAKRRRTRYAFWTSTEMISSSTVAQRGAIILERHLERGFRPAVRQSSQCNRDEIHQSPFFRGD